MGEEVCPLCGLKGPDLTTHVIFNHTDSPLCWCHQYVGIKMGQWWDHFEKHGGWRAHLNDTLNGVAHDPVS